MGKSAAGKGPDPRPMTPEGRANYEKTLRRIYGVRVKIPPEGAEKDALVQRIRTRIMGEGAHSSWLTCDTIGWVLDALAEEEG